MNDQILLFDKVMTFYTTRIKAITFIGISKDDMASVRERQKERYQLGNTVKGTRSSHNFEAQSCSAIHAKHLSAEIRFSINHSSSLPPEEAYEQLIASLKPNNYVTCQYGDYWWLALVMAANPEEKDFTCKFMHPYGHTETFYWPSTDDEAYIPFSKILEKVDTPTSQGSSERQYELTINEIQQTDTVFAQYN